jgi:hypothetical protein
MCSKDITHCTAEPVMGIVDFLLTADVWSSSPQAKKGTLSLGLSRTIPNDVYLRGDVA